MSPTKTPTKVKKAPAKKKTPTKKAPTKKRAPRKKKEVLPVEDLLPTKFDVVQKHQFLCEGSDLPAFTVKNVSVTNEGVTIEYYTSTDNLDQLGVLQAQAQDNIRFLNKSNFSFFGKQEVPLAKTNDIVIKILSPVGSLLCTQTYKDLRLISAGIYDFDYSSKDSLVMVLKYQ